jgi:2-polyprenyl-3-methyl-5-hydroxy-6-metoxy-1,4-benzoquinol methylase
MASIQDDRGFNQGFKPSKSLTVRNERRCDYIIGNLDVSKNIKILETGCGTGELSFMLAKKTGKEVTGIDLCAQFIDKAKEDYNLPNLNFEVIDLNNRGELNKKFLSKKFDYIVGNGILHHLYYNIESSLELFNSLLNPDGKIIFLEPNIFNPYCLVIFTIPFFRKLARLEPGEMAFSRKFISQKLIKAGYAKLKVEYRDFLVPGIPAFLISIVTTIGWVLEKIPFLRMLSQSIYISASKGQYH